MTTAINPTTNSQRKEIDFDSENGDYKMLLDGELIGFARTYHEAETTLDAVVFERLLHATFNDLEALHDLLQHVSERRQRHARYAVAAI